MHYQRALWLNRLLKEQTAQLTQGLTIEEVDQAKEALKVQLGLDQQPSDSYWSGVQKDVGVSRGAGRSQQTSSLWSTTPRRTAPASSAVNRKRRQQQIDNDNLAFLRRLQSVKSTFHKLPPPTAIPKLSAQ